MKQFFLPASDGLRLACALFEADCPQAIVQIIHGSVEHKERYYDFARFLNEAGYAVILSDNRGHGGSLSSHYKLGYMDDYRRIVQDQFEISRYARSIYPDKKLHLFGHSLGTVFARIYLERHDAEISKLILSGMVYYNPFTPIGILLARFVILFGGQWGYCKLLRELVRNGDDINWVSADQTNLEIYRNDPLCGYHYPNRSVLTIMEAVRELSRTSHFGCANPDLPILSVSGAEDPVTGGTEGLKHSFGLLYKSGYHTIENIVYPDMKHEVLHETDRILVYQDILNFLNNEMI